MKTKSGIDISYCQTSVNWNVLKTDFVIMRAGYGKYAHQKDVLFETHYDNAKNHKIPVGAYWYSYAMSEAEARQEAKACLQVIKGKKFEYPIFYDVEESKQLALGKAKVSAIIKAFCSELEKANYWVGFYTSASAYNSLLTDEIKQLYTCWIAHWNVNIPGINGSYGLWQYSVGHKTGITGDCDLDYCYVDYPKLIKETGKNGYKKLTKPNKPKKTVKAEVWIDDHPYSGLLEEE